MGSKYSKYFKTISGTTPISAIAKKYGFKKAPSYDNFAISYARDKYKLNADKFTRATIVPPTKYPPHGGIKPDIVDGRGRLADAPSNVVSAIGRTGLRNTIATIRGLYHPRIARYIEFAFVWPKVKGDTFIFPGGEKIGHKELRVIEKAINTKYDDWGYGNTLYNSSSILATYNDSIVNQYLDPNYTLMVIELKVHHEVARDVFGRIDNTVYIPPVVFYFVFSLVSSNGTMKVDLLNERGSRLGSTTLKATVAEAVNVAESGIKRWLIDFSNDIINEISLFVGEFGRVKKMFVNISKGVITVTITDINFANMLQAFEGVQRESSVEVPMDGVKAFAEEFGDTTTPLEIFFRMAPKGGSPIFPYAGIEATDSYYVIAALNNTQTGETINKIFSRIKVPTTIAQEQSANKRSMVDYLNKVLLI